MTILSMNIVNHMLDTLLQRCSVKNDSMASKKQEAQEEEEEHTEGEHLLPCHSHFNLPKIRLLIRMCLCLRTR